jgi:hypothetical protein
VRFEAVIYRIQVIDAVATPASSVNSASDKTRYAYPVAPRLWCTSMLCSKIYNYRFGIRSRVNRIPDVLDNFGPTIAQYFLLKLLLHDSIIIIIHIMLRTVFSL